MGVMAFPRRTIEADLKGHVLARQGAKRLDPAPEKQHGVGEDGNRRHRRAGRYNLAYIRQHEGLAAGHENLFDTERRRFARDPSYPLEAERAARRLGRGAHTAIIATQIAVEIRIKPQTRAYGPISVDIRGRLAMAYYTARASLLLRHIDQTVSGEAAPSFELWPKRWIATDDGYEIAPAAPSERRDQFRQ